MYQARGLAYQATLINEIFNSFLTGTKKALLQGPPGSGKSFIAESIAQQWLKRGDEFFVFVINAEKNKSEINYLPYTDKINDIRREAKTKAILKKSLVELTKAIPIGGDLASYLVETVSNSRQENKKEALRFYSEIEQLIILDIDRIIHKRKTLLIIDDIQWLDEGSLKISNALVENKLNEWINSFNDLSILCMYSGNEISISERRIEDFVQNLNFKIYKTSGVKKEEFLTALRCFGFSGDIEAGLSELLFSIIGGHLVLVKALAEYLASQPLLQEVTEYDILQNRHTEGNSIIEKLLTFRLKIIGVSSDQVIDILKYASVIGLSFKLEELECLSEIKKESIQEFISKSEKALLIDNNEKNCVFKHNLIREFFLERLSDEKYKYYYRFAECLRKLRPADYFIRAKYLFDSGHIDEALPIYIIAVLKNKRDGIKTADVTFNRIIHFTKESPLKDYFEKILLAYQHFEESQYQLGIAALDSIEDSHPFALIAEKYYLLSLCYLKSMRTHDLKISIEYLKSWDDLKEDEPEIWIRIMSTLMTIQTDVYNYDEAKKIERELVLLLTKRSKFDYSAINNLNIIRRKGSALHISETAFIRTKQSADYFSEIDASNSLLNPIQYYLSLVNCSGNLIAMGEYSEALRYSKQGLDLINEYSSVIFPESHICVNNYLIGGLLGKILNPSQAILIFDSLAERGDITADKMLIKNNCAISYIYDNQLSKASSLFKELFLTAKNSELDSYYIYFISINYASTLWLLGNRNEAKKIWKKMDSQIPNIPDKLYLEKRHALLKEVINTKDEMDWKKWDEYLQLNHPYTLGKGWKFYGKGFLFSDIQLWHES